MKCLITGGSGFIGTHLMEELACANFEVLNLDIERPKVQGQENNWVATDIKDRAAVLDVFGAFRPEAVVHLAARTDTLGEKLEDYNDNLIGTENILDAIGQVNSVDRFILTSTQFVHQGDEPPRSDLDFLPYTAYGESKVLNEKATRAAGLDCTWTIVRPTNIWGPWHPRYPKEFWRVLAKGYYFHPGSASVIRSYGYVKNVTAQIRAVLQRPPQLVHKKTLYLGDSPIELLDWVNEFSLAITGKPVKVVPRSLVRAMALVGDIVSVTGIRFPITSSRYRSMTTSNSAPMGATFDVCGHPPYSMEEGVRQTVEWLRQLQEQ